MRVTVVLLCDKGFNFIDKESAIILSLIIIWGYSFYYDSDFPPNSFLHIEYGEYKEEKDICELPLFHGSKSPTVATAVICLKDERFHSRYR